MGSGASTSKSGKQPNQPDGDESLEEPQLNARPSLEHRKPRGHGIDSNGRAETPPEKKQRALATKPRGCKPKKGDPEDLPMMDARLYNWLPPRAKDLDDDRVALRTLFAHTDGEKWYIKIGWKTYDDPSRWFGVSVEKSRGNPRIRGLDLKSNELKGKIPRELGSLIKLKTLHLEGNSLTGPIPAPVVLLTQSQLTSWSFKNNVSLSLPADLGAVTVLQTLNMPAQNLVGKVPGGLAYLKCLKSINLSQNRLTGPIPDAAFRDLSLLESLDFTFNLLTGELPKSLAALAFLNTVKLSCNKLVGTVPKAYEQLTLLDDLQLNGNRLTGAMVGSTFVGMTSLTRINLDGNIHGEKLPTQLGRMTALLSLRLAGNHFTGEVRPHYSMLTNLRFLDLSRNQLHGGLPLQFANLSSLLHLKCDRNGLTGELPKAWGALTQLRSLDLEHNDLTGAVPTEWRGLQRLRSLKLFDNLLGPSGSANDRELKDAQKWCEERLHPKCAVQIRRPDKAP
jgi:Leucine-rich repeat (LRR) protein